MLTNEREFLKVSQTKVIFTSENLGFPRYTIRLVCKIKLCFLLRTDILVTSHIT